MNNVAIIILHFGLLKNTLECLESVDKATYKSKSTVFLVDNGTLQLTKNNLKKFKTKINLISNKTNLGFAGGMNAGIKNALKEDFDYYLLLNNDVLVKPQIIGDLLKPFKKNDIGITGSLITYYDNPNKLWFGGGELNRFFCFTRHKNINLPVNSDLKNHYTDFISGASMMIKKDVFKKCGLLEEKYFLYWEDVDFCQKARKFGFKSYLVGKPLAMHRVSAAAGKEGSNKLSETRAYYFAKNPFVFMKKQQYASLYILTGIAGQIFIRLPYYFLTLQDFAAFKKYLLGLKDGFYFLLKTTG